MTPYTRYFWKELTEDGRFVDVDWANPDGYEHSDLAICHFHMKFSIEPADPRHSGNPKWHLMKFHGLKE